MSAVTLDDAAPVTIPYRRLAEPVPVVVSLDGQALTGTALGWRGRRVYLSWLPGGGLQHLGWQDADRVTRRRAGAAGLSALLVPPPSG